MLNMNKYLILLPTQRYISTAKGYWQPQPQYKCPFPHAERGVRGVGTPLRYLHERRDDDEKITQTRKKGEPRDDNE